MMYITITTVLILLLVIRLVKDSSPYLIMKHGEQTIDEEGNTMWSLNKWIFVFTFKKRKE
jgi:hypothetical protein